MITKISHIIYIFCCIVVFSMILHLLFFPSSLIMYALPLFFLLISRLIPPADIVKFYLFFFVYVYGLVLLSLYSS